MMIYDDKDDEIECEDSMEDDGFTPPGDVVPGRLHWRCFLDGRVGLALLKSPGNHILHQSNTYLRGVWTVGHGRFWHKGVRQLF